MLIDRWRYELRLMGKKVILAPVLIMLGYAGIAILMHALNADPARLLSSGLEMILPLAAGVIVATITSQDPALELQLTMPRAYHLTTLQRIGLIMLWTILIAFCSSLLITILRLGFLPQQLQSWSVVSGFLMTQLTWFSSLCWFVSVGLCMALIFRSSAAASGLLAVIWVGETFFKDFMVDTNWLRPVFLFPTTLTPDADFWLTNRIEVLLTGLILIVVGWLLLHNTEGLLKGSIEE